MATLVKKNGSVLRSDAPELRNIESIHRKQEQVIDAMEHGTITAKQAEQLNMAIKGLWKPVTLELSWMSILLKYGKAKVPAPRTPMLRNLLGLSPEVTREERESYDKALTE